MRRPLLALLALLALPAPAAARPEIQAHRGGSVLDGRPAFPENTLPAFRHAAREGWTIELDVKLTQDRVPVVFHDDGLARTTPCRGLLSRITLRALQRRCRTDVLGSPGSGLRSRRTRARVPVPTLAAVLAEMGRRRARLSVELKDVPVENARATLRLIARSRYPLRRLVLQSFIPQNLLEARRILPRVARAQLVLATTPAAAAVGLARDVRATWLSPGWPVSRSFVGAARRARLRVVPYTLNTRAEVRAAARGGVDAVITDDPLMARRALR